MKLARRVDRNEAMPMHKLDPFLVAEEIEQTIACNFNKVI